MKNVICPKCGGALPLEDVNVSTDLALCRSCGQSFAFSEIVGDAPDVAADLDRPPKGTWFRRDIRGFEVGSTTRSAGAIFLVPFMGVWSGFSLGGIYGSQVAKGEFNLALSLFGIPFVLGTLMIGSIAAMTVCGRIYVQVQGNEGVVFSGVGPIGWRRRFEWNDVTRIRRTEHVGRRGAIAEQITIEGQKRIDFGAGLKTERRAFLLAALRQMKRAGC